MTSVDVCLCILLVAGAFALISIAIFFIRALSTLENINMTMKQANITMDSVNRTVDDVNYKLDLMNAPIEKINGLFSNKSSSGLLGRTMSMAGAYRAGKKKKK